MSRSQSSTEHVHREPACARSIGGYLQLCDPAISLPYVKLIVEFHVLNELDRNIRV